MASANGIAESSSAQFESLRNEVCNAFARAAIAMRDASHAAENFSNWFSRVNSQNFPTTFQSGGASLIYGGQHQPYTPMQEENSKKRKNDQDDEPTGKKKRGPKEKKVKDKDAPRRAPSAYLIFQNEIRRKTKEQNPNIPNNELLQMISKKWSDLPSEERQPYVEMHEKLKGEYESKKEAYDAKLAGTDSATAEKPKSKISVSKVATAASPSEDEDDEEEEHEVSAAATPAVATSSSNASSSDEAEEVEEDSDEEDTPPPKKKAKKEHVRLPTPPAKAEKKDKKKNRDRSEKKR